MKNSLLLLSFAFVNLMSSSSFATNANDLEKSKAFLTNSTSAFEENKGQVTGEEAGRVKYVFKDQGLSIFLLNNGLTYQFNKIHYPEGYKHLNEFAKEAERNQMRELAKEIWTETYRMDVILVGANPSAVITTEGKSPDYIQYYNHNTLNVHNYTKVVYHNVYPNIDWVIYKTPTQIKYDFIVRSGGNPKQIKLQTSWVEDLKLSKEGDLILKNRMGSITEERPLSFQEEKEIKTSFKLENNTITFDLGNYDSNKTLVIDPNLVWATYYGAVSGATLGWDSKVDAANNVYLYGRTNATTNIASGGHQSTFGTGFNDVFLAKFTSAGIRLWATYYGGNLNDEGWHCTTDNLNNVYISGSTDSPNNIAFSGHQMALSGGSGLAASDGFLVKFNSSGVRQWGTYYGGANSADDARGIVVNNSGEIYLCGSTGATTGISTPSSHQVTKSGGAGNNDAFLVKFTTNGARLWGTYYGGTSDENSRGITLDNLENVFVSGNTSSTTLISASGHQATLSGTDDAFLVKFNPSGVRQWGTYYGGTGSETAFSCVGDALGNVYLAGWTNSTTAIASSGHQTTFGGIYDGFLVKFSSTGVRQWGTYYGGTDVDMAYDCAVDNSNNVYLCGATQSTSGISFLGIYPSIHQVSYGGGDFLGGDGFVVKFNTTGIRQWATYYGGSASERAYSCSIDGFGSVYISGLTSSASGIALLGHQNTLGSTDAFLAKFIPCIPETNTTTTASICANGTKTLTSSASGTGTWTLVSGNGSISGTTFTPSSAGSVTISYTDLCGTVTNITFLVSSLSTAPTSITGTTAICNGGSTTLTLSGGAAGTGATAEWFSGSCGGTSAGTGNSITVSPTSNTTYFVRYTGTCNTTTCASTTVTINSISTAPTSITGTTAICNGGSTTLTLSGGSAGTGATAQWFTGSCGGTSAGTGNSITVSPTSNTTYFVRYAGTCNTTTCASTTVTINSISTAPTSITGTTAICNGGSTTLTLSGGSAGIGATAQWFTGSCGGTSAGTGNSITISPTSNTTYFVRYAGTCNTTTCASQLVNVTPINTIGAGTSQTTCKNSPITTISLSTTGATGATFSGLPTGVSGNWILGAAIISGTPTVSGVFNYTVSTTGGCSIVNATGTITVLETNTVSAASSNPTICINTALSNITITTTGATGIANAGISGANGLPTGVSATWAGNTITISGTPTSAGTFNYSIPTTGACPVGPATGTITVAAVPIAGPMTGNQTICIGSTSTFTPNQSGGTWSSSDNSIAIVNSSGVITAMGGGIATISYTIVGMGGCSNSTATRTITVNSFSIAPTSISGVTEICNGTSTTLTLVGGSAATDALAQWFTGSCGGTFIGTGNSITVFPTSNTSYFVRYLGSCNTTTCASTLVTVVTGAPVQPSTITGSATVCSATSETYTVTNEPGVTYSWSYSGGGTPVSTTNSVTFVPTSSGTLAITATNVCGTSSRTLAIVVGLPASSAGTLSGTQAVCVGSTTSFTSTVIGGTWTSSNNAVATVNAITGLVTGISAGSATITYTVAGTGSCSSASDTRTVTVDPTPNAGTISGVQNICQGTTTTFTATLPGGTWSSSDNAIATVDVSGVITGVSQGSATINYTISGGGSGSCPNAIAIRIINVATIPNAGTLSGSQNICVGATETLISTATGGIWTSSNMSVATVNPSTGVITGLSAGNTTISYTVAGSGSCQDGIATLLISVSALANPGILTGVQDLCTGTVAIVSSSSPSGIWSSSDNSVATISNTGLITAISPGITTITYHVLGNIGCSNDSVFSTININESPLAPTVSISTGNSTICSGESVDISASGSGIGSVYNVFNSATNGVNLGTPILTVSPVNTTIYYVEAIATNGCTNIGGRVPITVTVNPNPIVSAGADQTTCQGTSITLSASGASSYLWNTSETTASISVSPNVATTYSVIGETAFGCKGYDTVNVNIAIVGTILAVADNFNVTSGEETTLNVLSNDSYSNVNVAITSQPLHGTAIVNVNGNIVYTSASNYNGNDTLYYTICDAYCSNICSSAMVVINIKEKIPVVISGGFSPNNDGINDAFNIQGIEQYPGNILSIYNRWGSLVYKASPYLNDWNGNSNVKNVMGSDKLTTGTYLYILELNSEIEPMKGTLELKRE